MRDRLSEFYNVWNDVLAEIPAQIWRPGIARKLIEKKLRLEDINPHRGEAIVRIVWHRGRFRGLFDESGDGIGFGDMHDAKTGGLTAWHFETADGDIGAGVNMLLQHELIIHFLDMVARENGHILRFAVANDVDVLIDRVGRARIPLVFGNPLTCRQDVETLVASGPEEVPAA